MSDELSPEEKQKLDDEFYEILRTGTKKDIQLLYELMLILKERLTQQEGEERGTE